MLSYSYDFFKKRNKILSLTYNSVFRVDIIFLPYFTFKGIPSIRENAADL